MGSVTKLVKHIRCGYSTTPHVTTDSVLWHAADLLLNDVEVEVYFVHSPAASVASRLRFCHYCSREQAKSDRLRVKYEVRRNKRLRSLHGILASWYWGGGCYSKGVFCRILHGCWILIHCSWFGNATVARHLEVHTFGNPVKSSAAFWLVSRLPCLHPRAVESPQTLL